MDFLKLNSSLMLKHAMSMYFKIYNCNILTLMNWPATHLKKLKPNICILSWKSRLSHRLFALRLILFRRNTEWMKRLKLLEWLSFHKLEKCCAQLCILLLLLLLILLQLLLLVLLVPFNKQITKVTFALIPPFKRSTFKFMANKQSADFKNC